MRDNKPEIDNPGKVASFGGAAEGSETALETATRELKEETNLHKNLEDFKFYYEDETINKRTSKPAKRSFYKVQISEDELAKLEIYEGQGYFVIKNLNDEKIVDSWRESLKALF